MQTTTKSVMTDKTTFTADEKVADGGRALLIEAFDFIKAEQTPGKMTVNFSIGGSISGGVVFEEINTITQNDRLSI